MNTPFGYVSKPFRAPPHTVPHSIHPFISDARRYALQHYKKEKQILYEIEHRLRHAQKNLYYQTIDKDIPTPWTNLNLYEEAKREYIRLGRLLLRQQQVVNGLEFEINWVF